MKYKKLILEKIIALKHVGFSLEEIKSSLENDDNSSIKDTLKKQLEMMEARIYEMQGNYEKAEKIYQQLCLLNPKKSSYFAAQIEKLKEKQNNK